MPQKKSTFVISLGGSLVVPDSVDAEYLKKIKRFFLKRLALGEKFILIIGGGKTCRVYQDALRASGPATNSELDWLGIYATRLNAGLVSLLFGQKACFIPDLHTHIKTLKKPLTVSGGTRAGQSSDGAMIEAAVASGSKTVINLSNIDYVYTKDPKKFADAQKIEHLSWNELLKITGTKWDPGKNVPFDPTAAAMARRHGIRAIIANGKNLKNLARILDGKKFIGTSIS